MTFYISRLLSHDFLIDILSLETWRLRNYLIKDCRKNALKKIVNILLFTKQDWARTGQYSTDIEPIEVYNFKSNDVRYFVSDEFCRESSSQQFARRYFAM